MKYLSVCSGIEAATCAWKSLGWEAVGFSEIEPFPCELLKHHYPKVKNFGDMTKYKDWNVEHFDLLVGGTPCQAFSIAGLRKGLSDPRGNLTLVFLGMIDHFKPNYVVWENVPGVLSDKTGAFDALLSGLNELGYVFDTDILDARHFGVPQRRRRVFVVAVKAEYINSFESGKDERYTNGELFSTEELLQSGYSDLWKARDKINSKFSVASIEGGGNAEVQTFNGSVQGHFTSLGNEEKASSESVKGGIDLSKSVCIEPKLYKTHPNDSRISECKDGLADTVSARYGTGGGNTPLVEQTKNEDIDVLDDQGGNADFMHVYKNVTGTLRSKSHVPMIVQKTEAFAATDYSGFTTSQKGLATLKAKGGVLCGGSENLVLQVANND